VHVDLDAGAVRSKWFVTQLLQEKCHEQGRNLFRAFVVLTQASDTVNRELL